MEKYLLVYEITEYEELGGGTYFEEFASLEYFEEYINDTFIGKDNRKVLKIYTIKDEYTARPRKEVIKYKVTQKP